MSKQNHMDADLISDVSEKGLTKRDMKQNLMKEMEFENALESIRKIRDEIKTMHKEQMNRVDQIITEMKTAYKQDIRKAMRAKMTRKSKKEPLGFQKEVMVPEPLAQFISVEKDSRLSGPQISKLVWQTLKDKNLVSPENKRVLRTNDEVTRVFGVPASVNNSNDHKDPEGFNFTTIITYISRALTGRTDSDLDLQRKSKGKSACAPSISEAQLESTKKTVKSVPKADSKNPTTKTMTKTGSKTSASAPAKEQANKLAKTSVVRSKKTVDMTPA